MQQLNQFAEYEEVDPGDLIDDNDIQTIDPFDVQDAPRVPLNWKENAGVK